MNERGLPPDWAEGSVTGNKFLNTDAAHEHYRRQRRRSMGKRLLNRAVQHESGTILLILGCIVGFVLGYALAGDCTIPDWAEPCVPVNYSLDTSAPRT